MPTESGENKFTYNKIEKKHQRLNALLAYYEQRTKYNPNAKPKESDEYYATINKLGQDLDRMGITPMSPEEWQELKPNLDKILIVINNLDAGLSRFEKDAIGAAELVIGSEDIPQIEQITENLNLKFYDKIPDTDAWQAMVEALSELKLLITKIKGNHEQLAQAKSSQEVSEGQFQARRKDRGGVSHKISDIATNVLRIKDSIRKAKVNLLAIKRDIAAK